MRNRIPTFVALALLSLLTAIGTSRVVQAAKRARRPAVQQPFQVFVTSSPELRITGSEGGPGWLSVAATADLLDTMADQSLVWYCKAYRWAGAGWEVAWENRYNDQPLFVPQGRPSRPTFSERLMLPPGQYAVVVGLTETISDPAGNLRASPIVARSANVVVR